VYLIKSVFESLLVDMSDQRSWQEAQVGDEGVKVKLMAVFI
jgi:hypothetical protein